MSYKGLYKIRFGFVILATFVIGLVAVDSFVYNRQEINGQIQESQKITLSEQQITERAKHMAMTRHVGPGSRADNGCRRGHKVKDQQGCWPVTDELKEELCQADVFYYRSVQQPDDNSCGSRSLANALAIRDAIELGSPEACDVKMISARYNGMHNTNNLTNIDIIKMARGQQLEHVYVLDYLTEDLVKKNCKKENPFTIISSSDHKEMVHGGNATRINREVFQKIRSTDTFTANFICFLEPTQEDNIAHAVLVSLIKQQGQRAVMIYMDSCNIPLSQEWQARAYMSYIYWQCVAV